MLVSSSRQHQARAQARAHSSTGLMKIKQPLGQHITLGRPGSREAPSAGGSHHEGA